ncbi:hypothetical protein OR16_31219 [Cupriavidus basilensis OR16]|uniref:Uncharacterized protein n=2 Tax=Cupriavidus basilensis TaxID=68895 RepID=H1SDB8_9BURK|nr:hypothetical protein OR16_31219 [Cupriavidus basilensis OR16]
MNRDGRMTDSSDDTAATQTPSNETGSAEDAFAQTARRARHELLRANERAESTFYETLRDAAPGDFHALAAAQLDLNQSIAKFAERYREAIAVAIAERARLLATFPSAVTVDNEVSHAMGGPLSALVKHLAKHLARQRVAALTRLDANVHTPGTRSTKRVKR